MYYIAQKHTGDFAEFHQNALAPVEHMFDNHIYCDSSWRWSKEVQGKVHRILMERKLNEGMVVNVFLRCDVAIEIICTHIHIHLMYYVT